METLSIQVLEDHPFQAQVVAQQLRTLGCRKLFCAADGETALVRLSSHGPVDIALGDINLPGMDGLTFLRKAAMGFLRRQQPESRLPLAINCPPDLLEEPDLPRRLQELLDYYRLPSSLINVEITENGLPGIAANSLENLLRLRLMSCGIAIDDFGTGTSSLQRLCQLPCNELRLDASFIHAMEQNPRVLAVVTSSLALAASLGMNAVAEGIESTGQLEQLRELGCAQGQGYLFGHPMPGREFANWLRRWPGSALAKEP